MIDNIKLINLHGISYFQPNSRGILPFQNLNDNYNTGKKMKALLFIDKKKLDEIDLVENNFEHDFVDLMNNYQILESHVIYFSGGDSKIKEILVKKEPSFSI